MLGCGGRGAFLGFSIALFFFSIEPTQARKTFSELGEKTKEAKNAINIEQKDSYGQISKLGKTIDKVFFPFFFFLLCAIAQASLLFLCCPPRQHPFLQLMGFFVDVLRVSRSIVRRLLRHRLAASTPADHC